MSRCSSGVEEGGSNSGAHMPTVHFLHSGGQRYAVQAGDGGVQVRSSTSGSFGGNAFPVIGYAGDRGRVAIQGFAMDGLLQCAGVQSGSKGVQYMERREVEGSSRPETVHSVAQRMAELHTNTRFANVPMHYQQHGKDPCHQCSNFFLVES